MKTATAALFGLLLLLTAAAQAARADEAAQCHAAGGSLLTGIVTQGPRFARGHNRRGVALSHTHITLRSDQDGQSYDVAMDNVFAAGYDAAGETVPAPLSAIAPGDRLALCGALYRGGDRGIHWVHTDCGKPSAAHAPDGWVEILGADGTPGPNLEESREYCHLWP
jgi:hypothetical protein